MTKGRQKPERRGKGRPNATESGVGREALIAAARDLLQELSPSHVTVAAVARRAGADPALIRYYFGNRENLLFEVAKQIGEEANRPFQETGDPSEMLAEMIRRTFGFTRSAKHMQRLMIEELDSASSAEVRTNMQEWNRHPLEIYQSIQDVDGDHALAKFDPLFMHLAVVGISDFFATGQPLIKLLVPEDTDMKELERQYEAFVIRLITKGLARD